MANVYYDPADYGLAKLDKLDEADLSYEYHMLVLFVHSESGRVFYASDSGCSCPTPFEDYRFHGPDETDLTEINRGDAWMSFVREVEGFPAPQSEREALIDAANTALRDLSRRNAQ